MSYLELQEVTNAFVGSKSQSGDISAITVAILEPKMLTKSTLLLYNATQLHCYTAPPAGPAVLDSSHQDVGISKLSLNTNLANLKLVS